MRGKWRLDTLLGSGGTAAVYAATHRNRSRAAIKMLHPELSSQPSVRGAFLREGYAANGVPHEGVVHVIDDDIAEDTSVFLVLELLDGRTLRSLLDETAGPLALEEALRVADRLLDVLGVAHARGIQHRDVTPKNVFLLRDGRIKLIDFGSAYVAELSQQSGGTLSGSPMGTPAFMSPELARGRFADVDPRSDVWSLGAVLYTMLTGKQVRNASTVNEELLFAMTQAPPSVAKARPDLPAGIVALVDRALAFDKRDRWPGARAMQEALVAARDAIARPLSDAGSEVVSTRPFPALQDNGEKTELVVPLVTPRASGTLPVPAVRSSGKLPVAAAPAARSSGKLPAAERAPSSSSMPTVDLRVSPSLRPPPEGGAPVLSPAPEGALVLRPATDFGPGPRPASVPLRAAEAIVEGEPLSSSKLLAPVRKSLAAGTIVEPPPLGGFEGGIVPYVPEHGMNPLFVSGEPKQARGGSEPLLSSIPPAMVAPQVLVPRRPRVGVVVSGALLVLGALVATGLVLVDRDALPVLARSSAATSTSIAPSAALPPEAKPADLPTAASTSPSTSGGPKTDVKSADSALPAPAPPATVAPSAGRATSTSSAAARPTRRSPSPVQSTDIVRVNPFDRRE